MNKNAPALNDLKEWLRAHARNTQRASAPDTPVEIPADNHDFDAALADLDLAPAGDDGLDDILDEDIKLELRADEGKAADASGAKLSLADLAAWDEARQKDAKSNYDRKRHENKVLKATGKLPRKNEKLSHLTPEQKLEREKRQRKEAAQRHRDRKKLKKEIGASK